MRILGVEAFRNSGRIDALGTQAVAARAQQLQLPTGRVRPAALATLARDLPKARL